MKVNAVTALIESDGWRLSRTKGSHRQFREGLREEGLSIPEPASSSQLVEVAT